MIRIFTNDPHVLFWLQEAGMAELWPKHDIISDISDYLSGDPGVTVIDVIDHEPSTLKLIQDAVDHSAYTIFFISEFTDDVLCRQFDRAGVTFFISGSLNYDLVHAQVLPYNIHLWEPVNFYRQHPALLNHLAHGTSKPKIFDVLLGRPKPHREHIFSMIDHEKNIVTMFKDDRDTDILKRSRDEFIWPNGISVPDRDICYTREQVNISDTWISISRVIPSEVYNQTYHSVVAETLHSGDWILFSEKIAKPILARRLFVVSSSRHYLRNLRRLGFRTFDGIIDESYDDEANDDIRVERVLDQIKQLCDKNQREIQHMIEPITEYNFNCLWHNRWYQDMLDHLHHIMTDIAKYSGGLK
jgi:hypothetical protein